MNTLKKILAALTFSILGLASTVSATIITDWNFAVDTAFTDSNLDLVANGSDINGGILNPNPTTLTWGTQNSSIGMTYGTNGHVEGAIGTGDGYVQSSELTHTNNPLSGGRPWLTSAEITTALWLSPALPNPPFDGVSGGFAPLLKFGIAFTETSNSGTCSVALSPTKCSDIFILDVSGIDFDYDDKTFSQVLAFAGNLYQATINIAGLDLLENAACIEATGAIGCYGLTTAEAATTSFDTSFKIDHLRSIPEPSPIILLGLALFGIASSMRNKHI